MIRQDSFVQGAALACIALALGCGRSVESDLLPAREYERDLYQVEEIVAELQEGLEQGLLQGLREGQLELASSFLTADFQGRVPQLGPLAAAKEERIVALELDGSVSDFGDWPTFASEFTGLPQPLERATIELSETYVDLDACRLVAEAELRLAGGSEQEGRVDLRLQATLEFQRERPDSVWRLRRFASKAGKLLLGRPEPFVDISAATGFDYHTSEENESNLALFINSHRTLALGGLTALDWNKDGFWDLIGTRDEQLTVLFLNDGLGGFNPAPLPIVSPRESGSFVLYVDLDGDGEEELISSRVVDYQGDRAHLALYYREAGEWLRDTERLEFANKPGLRRIAVQCILPFDANADGLLELFAAVYGDASSRGVDYNTVEAYDGGDNLYFEQKAALEFQEVSRERSLLGTQYTYVASAFDFDGDGDTDLWEGNDFGPNIVWRNDGEGGFQADDASPLAGVSAYTMGVTIADCDNSGGWSFYVSNMSSAAGVRVSSLASGISESMRETVQTIASGNRLYREADAWSEQGAQLGVNQAGWAWGCVFFDVENDGDQDLIVTNGFTTHSGAMQDDWDPYYWIQVLADARFLEQGKRSENVNIDHPFEGSFAGHQRDKLFLHAGSPLVSGAADAPPTQAKSSGQFHEVAWSLGLDAEHDGRCVIPVDVDGDGDLDLALWTLQGLRLFENRSPPRHYLRVALRATKSHPTALGAVVEIETQGLRLRRRMRLVEGFQTQLPGDLHFGLGEATSIERLLIRWPSGEVQVHEGLPVDRRVLIVEGESQPSFSPLPAWPKESAPGEHHALPLSLLQPAPQLAPNRIACVLELGPEVDGSSPLRLRSILADGGQTLIERSLDGPTRRAWLGPDASGAATLLLDANDRLARLFRRAASEQEVAAHLELLEVEPPFAGAMIERGRLLIAAGQFRQARGCYERILAADPLQPFAFEGLARAQLALGRSDLAEAAYQSAIQIDPDYSLAHYNLASVRAEQGRLSEALEPLQRALAIEGERLEWLLFLAELWSGLNQPHKAKKAAQRAVSSTKDSPDAHLLMGKLLAREGSLADARTSFERVLELNAQSADAKRALIRIRALLGNGR